MANMAVPAGNLDTIFVNYGESPRQRRAAFEVKRLYDILHDELPESVFHQLRYNRLDGAIFHKGQPLARILAPEREQPSIIQWATSPSN